MRRAPQPFDLLLDLVRSETDRTKMELQLVPALQAFADLQGAELSAGSLKTAEHEQQLPPIVSCCDHDSDPADRAIGRGVPA